MKDASAPRDDDDGAVNPGSNLFVTGIHPKLTEAEVSKMFEKYGDVEKCQIMRDPHTKESRGFGFVKMVTSEQAEAAKEGLQGESIEGRTLSIEKARRARPRTPTPGKYFGPPKRGKHFPDLTRWTALTLFQTLALDMTTADVADTEAAATAVMTLTATAAVTSVVTRDVATMIVLAVPEVLVALAAPRVAAVGTNETTIAATVTTDDTMIEATPAAVVVAVAETMTESTTAATSAVTETTDISAIGTPAARTEIVTVLEAAPVVTNVTDTTEEVIVRPPAPARLPVVLPPAVPPGMASLLRAPRLVIPTEVRPNLKRCVPMHMLIVLGPDRS